MIATISLRRLVSIAGLTFAWCALWGSLSIANAAGGVLLSAALTSNVVSTSSAGSIKAVPLLKLVGLVMIDLAKSTLNVATEILTPTDRTDEAIVAVHLPVSGRDHLLLVVVAVTLTPGTAVVDTDPDTGTIYLHLLHDQRRDETIEHVNELVRLACDALPVRATGANA